MNDQDLQMVDASGNAIATDQSSVPLNPWIGMIQQSIEKGADFSVVEKFIALQREEEDRQSHRAFNAAVSQLQSKMPEISKTGTAKFQTSKGIVTYNYDNLNDICNSIKPFLAELGLSYSWNQKQENGLITVLCTLSHASGHSTSCQLSSNPDTSGTKNNIQAIASTITYLQRYTIKSILGIASVDDDGAASESNKAEQQGKIDFVRWMATALQVMERQDTEESMNKWYSEAIAYSSKYNQKFVIELQDKYTEIKASKGWK